MPRTLFRFWAACLWAYGSLGARSALADDPATEPAEYRSVVDDALREYAAHNYEEARSLFHRANSLYPNARTQRGLGMAQFELRNYGECIHELEEALASPVRALTGPLRTETEALLARAQNFVARVKLRSEPADARLRINGVPWERHDELLLNVGDHALELSLPGYLPARRTLSVRGGEVLAIALTLEPASVSDSPGRAARDDRSPRSRWYKSAWLWSGVAVLVAGAAVTTGLLLTRERGSEQPYGGSSMRVVVGK